MLYSLLDLHLKLLIKLI